MKSRQLQISTAALKTAFEIKFCLSVADLCER